MLRLTLLFSVSRWSDVAVWWRILTRLSSGVWSLDARLCTGCLARFVLLVVTVQRAACTPVPPPRPHPHPVGRLCRLIGHLAIPSAVYWRQPLVDVPSPELCSLKFLLCFISPVGHFLFLFLVWFWIFLIYFFSSALVACDINLVMLWKLCLIFSWIWRSPEYSAPPVPSGRLSEKKDHIFVHLCLPNNKLPAPPPPPSSPTPSAFFFCSAVVKTFTRSMCAKQVRETETFVSLWARFDWNQLVRQCHCDITPSTVTFPVPERTVTFFGIISKREREMVPLKGYLAVCKREEKKQWLWISVCIQMIMV